MFVGDVSIYGYDDWWSQGVNISTAQIGNDTSFLVRFRALLATGDLMINDSKVQVSRFIDQAGANEVDVDGWHQKEK